ncbi:MAG: hypothetical protein H7Y36_03150, partial [Armatimonadetes bacterium]|nr:hypothetical protein [Akkermansiaceae bacterium]
MKYLLTFVFLLGSVSMGESLDSLLKSAKAAMKTGLWDVAAVKFNLAIKTADITPEQNQESL